MVASTELPPTTPIASGKEKPKLGNGSSPSTVVSVSGMKPQSFSLSALHATDFNAQSFIADRRRHTPLSLVRDELRSYTSSLSSQIVHALQKDFNLFTNFGPSLSDATILAKAFMPSLSKLNEHLYTLDNNLQSQTQLLNDALTRRHQIKNRHIALQILVSVNDSLIKCERLLRQYSASLSTSTNPLNHQSLSLLDRITAETAQLSFTLTRAQSCKFLHSLSSRVSTVKRQVRTSLDQCLQKALPNHPTPFNPDTLSTVLTLYVVAGMQDDAHDFFTRQVVSPFASQRLRMSVMLSRAERNNNSGSTVTPGDALRATHDEIVSFLGERVLPLVSLCESDVRLAKRLDFVGHSVWPHIQKAISSNMAPAFSPGIPDVFHRSFQAGVDIFSAIESTAADHFKLDLRTSSTTNEFWRHWNLPVYFQLRFQEITTSFESQLLNGPTTIDTNTTTSATSTSTKDASTLSSMDARLLRTDVYRSSATAALVGCLRRCWSDDVFLPALTHRFVRLSLQLIARYTTWVRTGLAGEWTGEKEGVEKGAARIIHDIGIVQKRLPAELASVLRARCPGLGMETVESIENGFAEAVDRYGGLVPDIIESIADTLGRACSENVQPLRGIIATYRMKSKQAPSRHNSFVPKILRPLRVFLKENENIIQNEEDIGKVIGEKVVEITSGEYFIMATELVEKNKNSEATLKRLNIGRGNAAAGKANNGMSVVEKIAMQLFLDVEQFADEVTGFGIDVERIASLKKLRSNVRHEKEVSSSRASDYVDPSDTTVGDGGDGGADE